MNQLPDALVLEVMRHLTKREALVAGGASRKMNALAQEAIRLGWVRAPTRLEIFTELVDGTVQSGREVLPTSLFPEDNALRIQTYEVRDAEGTWTQTLSVIGSLATHSWMCQEIMEGESAVFFKRQWNSAQKRFEFQLETRNQLQGTLQRRQTQANLLVSSSYLFLIHYFGELRARRQPRPRKLPSVAQYVRWAFPAVEAFIYGREVAA